MALLIPLYELIIYPITHRWFPSIKICHKFILGVALQMLTVTFFLIFDSMAIKALQGFGNYTIHCALSTNQGTLNSTSDSKWITTAQLLDTISQAVICKSALEFFASQTPYSMRGLMLGVGYGSILLSSLFGSSLFLLVTHQSSAWATGIISCEFWYLFSLLLGLIILSGLLLAVGRWYKNRKREDVLPNEHIFAERYYSRIL